MIALKRHSQGKTPAVANGLVAADDIRVDERTRPYREAEATAELRTFIGRAVPVHPSAQTGPKSLGPSLATQSHPPVVAEQRIVRRGQVGIERQRRRPNRRPLATGQRNPQSRRA